MNKLIRNVHYILFLMINILIPIKIIVMDSK